MVLLTTAIKPCGVRSGAMEEIKREEKRSGHNHNERQNNLSPEQYRITRLKGTEPPYAGKYCDFQGKGIYCCVCCGNALFSSDAKFNIRAPWPAFWTPMSPSSVKTKKELFLLLTRIEVACRQCDAHLGYAFEDNRPPTGVRYVINSAALLFIAQREQKDRIPATAPCPSAPR
jgi:peptide-methionine (R)-S-oxide reductase